MIVLESFHFGGCYTGPLSSRGLILEDMRLTGKRVERTFGKAMSDLTYRS